jgi:hypothetical protein
VIAVSGHDRASARAWSYHRPQTGTARADLVWARAAGRAQDGQERTVQGSAAGDAFVIVQRRPAKECEKIALALALQ